MNSYRDWHVGMQIVCVDDELHRLGTTDHTPGPESVPVAGCVYTIREIGFLYPFPFDGYLVVRLSEIINKPLGYCHAEPYEAAFSVQRFRPVQTRKTSIEVFERLLTPTEHDKHLVEVHDFVSVQELFQ